MATLVGVMSASPPKTDATESTPAERRWLIALLVLAAVLRIGVIVWKPESLAEDRDLYWGIARQLAVGNGYVHPDSGQPTAYRPPLYPLMLAGVVIAGGGPQTLGVVQIALSIATVWLTWRLARKLGVRSAAWLAASLVAFNPLLIQASVLAMTEVLCAFLLMALFASWLMTREPLGSKSRCWVGVFTGLAILCRPTVWAFVVIGFLVGIVRWGWSRCSSSSRSVESILREWCPIVVACGLTISPWVVRNWLVFDRPIVTTTHGGYTLLLGNNDEAYRAEIVQPTSEPWDSREFQKLLQNEMRGREAGIPDSFEEIPVSEPDRDRWMSQRALRWIYEHPREFLESCWLRVKRFWSVFPGGADAGSLPMIIRWGIAVFFAIESLAAAVGVWRLRRDEWAVWWPLVLLLISFALVHVVYWSNMRMRAPVEPVLALLAARGLMPRCGQDSRTATVRERPVVTGAAP